jgi:hypothetical protein
MLFPMVAFSLVCFGMIFLGLRGTRKTKTRGGPARVA